MEPEMKKPVLGEGELNKHLAGLSQRDLKAAAGEIKPPGQPLNRGALEAWVRRHFTLTKDIEDHIRHLPDADKEMIERAAAAVENGATGLSVEFVPLPRGRATREVTINCQLQIHWK